MSKKPFPGCELSLSKYYALKVKLYNHFFRGEDLNIKNNDTVLAYTYI